MNKEKNKSVIARKVFQIAWLGNIALISLVVHKLFLPNADYAKLFMYIHIFLTIIFTQVLMGLAEIFFKRKTPWIDLLSLLLITILGTAITLLLTCIISVLTHIPFAIIYIIITCLSQIFSKSKTDENLAKLFGNGDENN